MKIVRIARRLQRRLLQRIYGFDSWHVGHAGEAYADGIVSHLNRWPTDERGSVVEIGCGLGDILRRLRFQSRLGLDRDPGALKAARFLSRFSPGDPPRFEQFEFPRETLAGRYHAIVMVNWIHQIDPETLQRAIAAGFRDHLLPGGAIVVDTVADPAYTYNHDIQRLTPPGASAVHLGRYPNNRDIWMLR